ncbi:endonuclease V [Nocardia sp. NPDC052566]|uniref:endonuclease V n=1 Tax=Nocardia sp. NPDC052566 TaxID=3364330 RepID=UPI0037C50BE1
MKVSRPARWPADADEAIAVQDRLRPLVDPINPGPPEFRTVAGLDSAYAETGEVATAVVVLDTATAELVDSSVAYGTVDFPYIPGLLAFRELPTTVDALEKLSTTPDLLICDGHGLAHPRLFGLACHLGVLTGLPTIGVAKNVWGEHTEPAAERGATADVTIDGRVVGRVLRTRTGVKPVFVSVGHRIDLDTACAQVLTLTPNYRQPETTRLADQRCRAALREHLAGRSATA